MDVPYCKEHLSQTDGDEMDGWMGGVSVLVKLNKKQNVTIGGLPSTTSYLGCGLSVSGELCLCKASTHKWIGVSHPVPLAEEIEKGGLYVDLPLKDKFMDAQFIEAERKMQGSS